MISSSLYKSIPLGLTLSAVTGQTVGQIGASNAARGLVATAVDETVRVADSQNVPVSRDRIEAALRSAYEHAGEHKTSMLQDRKSKRRTEADRGSNPAWMTSYVSKPSLQKRGDSRRPQASPLGPEGAASV